ncbi:heavy metal-binding domain-containing protein [Mucilaginibacter litoreus]|uniref:Heavy metal-binding domain-containing protein n=1 Tax=Mucilaginibacter litoreus TaxID=1048221 RepID=A0ABW3AQL9_9SPHI
MRRYIIVLAAIISTLSFVACNTSTNKNSKATEAAKPKGKYYCTMHPEVTSDKPGTCSKCGMDLVERDTTK